MTHPIRAITMRTSEEELSAREPDDRVRSLDLYDLSPAELDGCRGLMLSLYCDQIFLERNSALLTDFVRGGGRILVNGHVQIPFLPGLSRWKRIDFSGPEDLRPACVTPHPIWEGVDYQELLYRSWITDPPPRGAELARYGVAGFYGRGYHSELPEDATVINGIGPYRLPVDISYPLGDGAVLAHAGNDLAGFADPQRSTRHLASRLLDWLEGR